MSNEERFNKLKELSNDKFIAQVHEWIKSGVFTKSDTATALKLFAKRNDEVNESDTPKWYCIIGAGINGVEMLVSSEDIDYVRSRIDPMSLRARINGHRDIKIYSWIDDHEVSITEVEERLDEIVEHCEFYSGLG